MNEENPEYEVPPKRPSFFLVLLLALSILIFLAWQVYILSQGHNSLEQQFIQRQKLVVQSKEVQNNLQKVATDLIALSATDPDAKALVEKAGIHENKSAAAK